MVFQPTKKTINKSVKAGDNSSPSNGKGNRDLTQLRVADKRQLAVPKTSEKPKMPNMGILSCFSVGMVGMVGMCFARFDSPPLVIH